MDVPLLRTGIAWPSDKESKFRNPPLSVGQQLKDGKLLLNILLTVRFFKFIRDNYNFGTTVVKVKTDFTHVKLGLASLLMFGFHLL